MTYYSNYATAHKSCYAVKASDGKANESTLKEKIISLMYPAVGILGFAYHLYLLLSR